MKVLMHKNKNKGKDKDKSKANASSSTQPRVSPVPSVSPVSPISPVILKPPEPPTHQLPVEILQVIFLLVMNDVPDCPNIFSFGKNVMRANFSSPPLLFTRVCRLWRDAAHLTPGIWSRIYVGLPGLPAGPFNSLFTSLLQSWLVHSGSQLLTLRMHRTASDNENDPAYVRSSIANSRMLEILFAEAERWETVFGASDIFEESDSFNTPHLKTLECYSSDITKFDAPNLYRLRVIDQLMYPLEFATNPTSTNLRHLYLQNAAAGAIRSFAAMFPRLETLEVDELAPHFGPGSHSDIFPCLELISLPYYHSYHAGAYIDVFRGLQVPKLQKLTVVGEPSTSEVEGVLVGLASAATRNIPTVDFQSSARPDTVEVQTVEALLMVALVVTVRGEVVARREVAKFA